MCRWLRSRAFDLKRRCTSDVNISGVMPPSVEGTSRALDAELDNKNAPFGKVCHERRGKSYQFSSSRRGLAWKCFETHRVGLDSPAMCVLVQELLYVTVFSELRQSAYIDRIPPNSIDIYRTPVLPT